MERFFVALRRDRSAPYVCIRFLSQLISTRFILLSIISTTFTITYPPWEGSMTVLSANLSVRARMFRLPTL